MMNAYTIKEFHDESQYPRWNRAATWRWEFLRRNPDYQSFFEAHKSGLASDEPTHSLRELLSRYGIRVLRNPREDEYPPGAFYTMTGGSVIDTEEVARNETTNLDLAARAMERSIPAEALLLSRIEDEAYRRYPPGTALVVIDTTIPLEPQIASAKKTIKMRLTDVGRLPALRNNRIAEWRGYLRVLDGRAAGASDAAIAAAVYPDASNEYPDYLGRTRVENAHKRGMNLVTTFGIRGFEENFSTK